MAQILVDSCVILDLADPTSDWHEWAIETLEKFDTDNRFIINPIIYTECSVGFQQIEEVEALFKVLAFEYAAIPLEALFLAGKVFAQYRRNKGAKLNVLPDFFIGAHAAVEQMGLITRDKGRFTTYFPTLKLIMPSNELE